MPKHDWSLLKKIAFRFSFILILCFILVMNNGAFPFFEYLNKPFVLLTQKFTPWFAKNILHYKYDYSVYMTGSGDTSYAWITLLILILLATLGTTVWSIIDRDRKGYHIGYYWLTTFVRYYIAFMLINYGVAKLVHSQMLPPGLNRLMQPLGEFSPMGLAWTFLGYSKGYNIFMGVVEILAGLLLFRKTVVLGALITMATSINIMTVNYFFDVPVKMMSSTLFLLSLFLLVPYIKPLFEILILGKSTQLKAIYKPTFDKHWKNRLIFWGKIFIIGIFLLQQASGLMNRHKFINHYYKKSPFYGIYMIEGSEKHRRIIPNDWSFIVFEYEGNANVRDKYYRNIIEKTSIDTKTKKISINNYTLDYVKLENGDIILSKYFKDQPEKIKLIKQKPEEYELMKREFNWIQEYPYNR